jgi:hypothetical protein
MPTTRQASVHAEINIFLEIYIESRRNATKRHIRGSVNQMLQLMYSIHPAECTIASTACTHAATASGKTRPDGWEET